MVRLTALKNLVGHRFVPEIPPVARQCAWGAIGTQTNPGIT